MTNHKLRSAIRLAIFAGAAASLFNPAKPAMAQTAAADTEPSLQEVVVTGSLIRRTDTETASPVQVITQEDLKDSGLTTVSDVLRNLSANGAGTLSQSFNQAFAGGGAGVALRGLSVGGTLTLIDGHRMVGYPLTDDGERNFVDVTAIPFNAVESVDVLLDSASAQYGSDAIAGVVNIKLRKTYTGGEFDVEGGTSQHNDGTLAHVTGIVGAGDLASDGFNIWVSGEYRHQGQILLSNRSGDFTNLDFTRYGASGVNTTPGAGTDPFIPYPGSLTGYFVNPATGAEAFLPGCSAAAQAANQCTYKNAGLQLQPVTSSANVMSKMTFALGGDWQSVTTGSIFRTGAQQAGTGYVGTGYAGGGPVVISLPPFGNPTPHIFGILTVPANYPGNPFGVPAGLVYNFPELGFPYTQFNTNTFRLVQEFNGTAGGWDVHASAGYMYSKLTQDSYGAIEPGVLQADLNNGYILGNYSSAQTPFAPTEEATDSSYLSFANVNGSRKLADLPGGELTVAAGAEWFEKKLNSTAPATNVEGIQTANDAWAIGSQADTAGYAEIEATAFKMWDVDASGRYDYYNSIQAGQFTPKFGVTFKPFSMLKLRGTYGKGFRAPSIPETSSGAAFGASTAPDPILCANGPTAVGSFPSQCAVQVTGVQTSGTHLKPEKTDNLTAGFIFEPIKQLNFSVDYYDIKVKQDIVSLFEADGLGLNIGPNVVRGNQVVLPQVQANGTLANVLTPVGLLLYQGYPYINATQDETSGVDLDLKSHFGLGAAGKLTAEVTYTHIIKYNLEALGVTYSLAGTHGPSGVSGDTGNPKDRAKLMLTWDRGPFSLTGTVNYIGSFNVTDPSAGQFTCAEALTSNATSEGGPKFTSATGLPSSLCTVGSFTDVDLYGKVDIGEHFQIHGAINNLFNTQPPLDVVTYGGGGGSAYDAAMHQAGAVGRYFTLGASYKF